MTNHELAKKAVDFIMQDLHYESPTDLTLGDDPLTGQRNSAVYTDGVVYDYLHAFDCDINDILEEKYGFWLENYGQGIYIIMQ